MSSGCSASHMPRACLRMTGRSTSNALILTASSALLNRQFVVNRLVLGLHAQDYPVASDGQIDGADAFAGDIQRPRLHLSGAGGADFHVAGDGLQERRSGARFREMPDRAQ